MRGMRAIPWPEAETGASPNLPSGNSPIHQAKEMLASCSSFISSLPRISAAFAYAAPTRPEGGHALACTRLEGWGALVLRDAHLALGQGALLSMRPSEGPSGVEQRTEHLRPDNSETKLSP
jgi:hypothetical protein